MKNYFLLIALAGLFLSSCTKCKDCEVKVEVLSTSSLDDAACALMGDFATCQEYYDSILATAPVEYCDDELDAAEEMADITTTDTRVYWDCK